jgi:hypothetical protein
VRDFCGGGGGGGGIGAAVVLIDEEDKVEAFEEGIGGVVTFESLLLKRLRIKDMGFSFLLSFG